VILRVFVVLPSRFPTSPIVPSPVLEQPETVSLVFVLNLTPKLAPVLEPEADVTTIDVGIVDAEEDPDVVPPDEQDEPPITGGEELAEEIAEEGEGTHEGIGEEPPDKRFLLYRTLLFTIP
jgi:hypothetical protein